MNLTEDQISEIIRLKGEGKSQNEISSLTGISKPYVNFICQKVDAAANLVKLNGIDQPPLKTVHEQWAFPSGSIAELRYKDQRISDLESHNRDLKQELANLRNQFEVLKKEHDLLQIDHRSIEAKHKYEKDNIVAQQAYNQKSSLDGLVDKVLSPILSNEKMVDAISLGIMAKLGGSMTQQQQEHKEPLHPLINDSEVGNLVKEIYQVLPLFTKNEIEHLHKIFGFFMHNRQLLPATVKSLENHIQNNNNHSQ